MITAKIMAGVRQVICHDNWFGSKEDKVGFEIRELFQQILMNIKMKVFNQDLSDLCHLWL